MSEKEFKKCPKCGGEMERAEELSSYPEIKLAMKGDWRSHGIIPFCCKDCGYVELYKEMKEKKVLSHE